MFQQYFWAKSKTLGGRNLGDSPTKTPYMINDKFELTEEIQDSDGGR